MDNEFPPNSHAKKEVRRERPPAEKVEERRVVRQVTTGKVTLRKKPLHKKFFEAFRPEDNKGFVEYTLIEVLVPGIKDSMADAVHTAIDNALGTNRPRGSRRRDERGRTSYNRMAPSRGRGVREDDRRSSRREDRPPADDRDVIVDSRVEAEEILDSLIELASKYGVATKRDLMSMVGEPHEFTDEDWGWRDLRGARIHRVGSGYLLDLPRPEFLD